ncbi:hypothetical protein EMCRGX_G001759 [Ephydatia muelleri]
MPLHVMANFGGFLCECGLEGYVSLLIMLCYLGDAFVMQYISPINLLKANLVYGYHKRPILLRPRTKTRRHQQEHLCIGIIRGDRCLKDYGFRLSQAVDSAEVTLS